MMKPLLRFQLFTLSILLAALNGQAQSEYDTSFYLGGIQVGEYDQSMWTSSLVASGMNTVEVTVYARQGDWDTDNLQYDEQDEGAMNQIRAAKSAGLKVVLICRVALDHAYERNKFLWHGMIMPKSNKMLDAWFKKYREFVLKWGEIAQDEDVEVLVIGSELNALTATVPITELSNHYKFMRSSEAQLEKENRALKYEKVIGSELWVQGYKEYNSLPELIHDRVEANTEWTKQISFSGCADSLELMNKRRERISNHWKRLIRKTRRRFSGQLSYASNFDSYFEVSFWNRLDFIGVNAYFPLRSPSAECKSYIALKRMLYEGWEGVFDEIETFREEFMLEEIPLLFTELGYTHYANTTLEPWSGFGFSVVVDENNNQDKLIVWNQQRMELQERALAIEALREIVKKRSINLQGLLYWKLTTMPSQLPIEPFAILLDGLEKDSDPAVLELSKFIH